MFISLPFCVGTCSSNPSHPVVAVQVMAESIHHARKSLSPLQLGRCVHFLALLVGHAGLPPAIRNISLRVLLGLVDSFLPLARSTALEPGTKVVVRGLLTRLLACLVACTKLLQSQVCRVCLCVGWGGGGGRQEWGGLQVERVEKVQAMCGVFCGESCTSIAIEHPRLLRSGWIVLHRANYAVF